MCARPRSKRKPVFIDTSPLLLLLVGIYNQEMIGKARRLKDYKPAHFDVLWQFLAQRRIYITPGVLAEVTNLADQTVKANFEEFVEANSDTLEKMVEYYVQKNDILKKSEFARIGYTDTSILAAAEETDGEVLTSDHPLYLRCKKSGLDVTHMDALKERAEVFKT
ncbi:hypothetical protein DRN85_08070 [Methanosarcinales archaeon]|nr:MAG: hypothetical protein DRN85_08070 [Methanosarcinales archaeon]